MKNLVTFACLIGVSLSCVCRTSNAQATFSTKDSGAAPSADATGVVRRWAEGISEETATHLMAAYADRVRTLDAEYVLRPAGGDERNVQISWDRKVNAIRVTLDEKTVPDGRRLVSRLVRNERWQWEAHPEDADGISGTWVVAQTSRERADADADHGEYLNKVAFRLDNLVQCFTPLHLWDEQQGGFADGTRIRFDSVEVAETKDAEPGQPSHDQPEAQMRWGVYQNEQRVGEYVYEVAVRQGFRILSCSLRGTVDGKTVEGERFDYGHQKLHDEVWVPTVCRYKNLAAEGAMDDGFELRFSKIEVNKPLAPDKFVYVPPFASRVHVDGGEGNRVGYADPHNPLGKDPNDTRLETTTRP